MKGAKVYLYGCDDASDSSKGHKILSKSARELCEHLGLGYNKQHGNIFQIIKRKQKSLLGKYILRHPYDDEFKK